MHAHFSTLWDTFDPAVILWIPGRSLLLKDTHGQTQVSLKSFPTFSGSSSSKFIVQNHFETTPRALQVLGVALETALL